MASVLRYGERSQVFLSLPPEVVVAQCDAPRGEPLTDLGGAVATAVAAPVDFPPLKRATVPGDRIAIAVEHGVPQAAEIVAAVIDNLVKGGADPANIKVLRSSTDVDVGTIDPRSSLSPELKDQIALETHHPGDKGQMSYLAASAKGAPIYLNRTLADADFIVPIGCLRVHSALGYHGVHDALFPTFSDQETQDRFRVTDASHSESESELRRQEAQEVAWLLGILFTIQVVPGAGESVLHVLAGEPGEVFKRGSKLCQAAWSYSVPTRASLVVAAIEGSSDQQTWENVARALAAASRAVVDDGAIALCTAVEAQPGPSLRRVAKADDPDRAIRRIRKEKQPDLVAAAQLAQTLERVKVYFLSRLDEEVVEELGVAHVQGVEEIERLARRHHSCILLSNAQHAVATPEDEA